VQSSGHWAVTKGKKITPETKKKECPKKQRQRKERKQEK
jgi:hypothetical protein